MFGFKHKQIHMRKITDTKLYMENPSLKQNTDYLQKTPT